MHKIDLKVKAHRNRVIWINIKGDKILNDYYLFSLIKMLNTR